MKETNKSDGTYQKVQGVWRGTPILSWAMKLTIVSVDIWLGENDIIAGSSLLTTWLGMDKGNDRLAVGIIFSAGDDIIDLQMY